MGLFSLENMQCTVADTQHMLYVVGGVKLWVLEKSGHELGGIFDDLSIREALCERHPPKLELMDDTVAGGLESCDERSLV